MGVIRSSFAPFHIERGVMVMVTWEELFQFCMVIIAVIALVFQANK